MSFEVPGVRGSAGHRMSPTVLLLPLNHWLPETGNTCLLLTANQWSIKRPVRRCAAGAPPARPFDWRGRGDRRLCIIDQEVASRALWIVGDEKWWLIKWIRPPPLPPPPHTLSWSRDFDVALWQKKKNKLIQHLINLVSTKSIAEAKSVGGGVGAGGTEMSSSPLRAVCMVNTFCSTG